MTGELNALRVLVGCVHDDYPSVFAGHGPC
jgi:hypothetical protein